MANPFDIILFGGSSYLAERRLIPALYSAFVENKLDAGTRIIVTCRTSEKVENYLQSVRDTIFNSLSPEEFSVQGWEKFSALIEVLEVDVSVMDSRWEDLNTLIQSKPEQSRVFYMAIPSTLFGVCCRNLSDAGAISKNSRVVVEEPIGFDASSSAAINTEISRYFSESSIYRIDHYMGKETVQNLMALRFTNFIFEQLWDSKSIDHVQISISETVGLEGRAGFYDEAGALRDMVQNHLLQLLCLVAMESPQTVNAKKIHAEKIKVLNALRPISAEDAKLHTVRGQYVAGNYQGDMVHGYLEELNQPSSSTETFVAMRAYIDNWRWARVPFYLRTGKRMKQRSAEIIIQFKDVSHRVYDDSTGHMAPNRLVIHLQPDEQIQLSLMSKNLEELDMQLQPTSLNLNFSDTYGQIKSDAYKRLILDAANDNPSLFIHRDEVEQAWAWIDPIIDAWKTTKQPAHLYRAGTWGPSESDDLMAADGREWFNGGEAIS